ncbi:hypothetical protein CGRA01v4_13713 [Colletotrichum graminicola]|nr:hypothetical protein CGRA01v4_13713 [Colletotrichum graminicola]
MIVPCPPSLCVPSVESDSGNTPTFRSLPPLLFFVPLRNPMLLVSLCCDSIPAGWSLCRCNCKLSDAVLPAPAHWQDPFPPVPLAYTAPRKRPAMG